MAMAGGISEQLQVRHFYLLMKKKMIKIIKHCLLLILTQLSVVGTHLNTSFDEYPHVFDTFYLLL